MSKVKPVFAKIRCVLRHKRIFKPVVGKPQKQGSKYAHARVRARDTPKRDISSITAERLITCRKNTKTIENKRKSMLHLETFFLF